MLRTIQVESRSEIVRDGDIPTSCRECIQKELDKPYVQMLLAHDGFVGIETIEDMPSEYSVGLKPTEIYSRDVVFEKKNLPAESTEKQRTYHIVHCNRAVQGRPVRKEQTVQHNKKYL